MRGRCVAGMGEGEGEVCSSTIRSSQLLVITSCYVLGVDPSRLNDVIRGSVAISLSSI